MYVTTIQIYETVIVNRQQTSTGLGLRQFLEKHYRNKYSNEANEKD